MPAIRLVKTRNGCAPLEREDRYDVIFKGEKYTQLYFNTRGYVGNLPAPHPERPGDTIGFNVGERSIAAYKREVGRLNREWAELGVK